MDGCNRPKDGKAKEEKTDKQKGILSARYIMLEPHAPSLG
jgi:hypothetical protein